MSPTPNATTQTQTQAATPAPYQPGVWKKDNRIAMENDHSRLDIAAKVTGHAKYTTDIYPKNLIWANYIRCPYGSAKIASIKLDAAKAVPGVLDVQLDKQEGTYAGDRLGYICAESRAALEEAFFALQAKFRISQPDTDVTLVMTPVDKVEMPPKNAQNLTDASAALASAATVIEATYQTQIQTHTALEVHNGVVDFQGDHAIAWGSTQGTFGYRGDLAEPLGLEAEKIQFHCEYVGGGFGAKFGAGPDGDLAAKMSKKFNRPCKVRFSRKEEHEDMGCRPGSVQYMKLGVDKSGKFVGGRIHTAGSVGPVGGGGGVTTGVRYDYGKIATTHEDVHLNGGHPQAMRAPGRPQGGFAMEMFNDEMAAKIGMDPVEFRILNDPNLVRQEMYKVGAEMIGWKDRQPNGQSKGPLKIGYGVGNGDWGNRVGKATVTVQVYPNGTVEVLNGAQDIGTGFRTLLGDCVATTIGVPAKFLDVKIGCSDYPDGPGSGGSTTSRSVAPRALGAGQQAKDAILALVAKEWKLPDASSLKIENGVISGGGQTIDWAKACKLMTGTKLTFTVSDAGKYGDKPTKSETVSFAKVEVDVETGITRVKKFVVIQDMGKCVNRNTAENQMTGAVIQGLSYALFENRILNFATGAMVNPTMDSYKIAGALDIPEIIPVIWEQAPDSPVNSLGEPTIVPVAGAIACAIFNAIGVPVRQLPITPARVLEALGLVKGDSIA